jgi:polar amino acid transport system substrate-binding protein
LKSLLLFFFSVFVPLATAEQVVVAYNDDWAPYSAKGTGSSAKGILVDLLQEALGNRMGMEVKHIALPWGRVQEDVRSGAYDAFITVPTAERLTYVNSSQQIAFTVEMRAFVNRHSSKKAEIESVTGVDQFAQLRVCDIFANGWAKRLYEQKQIKVQYFRDSEVCFRQIAAGRYDITLEAAEVGRMLQSKDEFKDEITMLPAVIDQMDFTFMINQKSKHVGILARFDEVIVQMQQEGVVREIVARHLSPSP